MPDCREFIYSNEYYDFIIPYSEAAYLPANEGCTQRVDEGFDIYYYPREGLPELRLGNYSYLEIPKCYGLLGREDLEQTGILALQNQPSLALKGDGVLVGFIDTGIDYQNPLFRYSDGSTRIVRLWDQSITDGTPPVGILYGADYSADQINEALESENPYGIVPSRDEIGHGTYLAGIACGGEDGMADFTGAAPQAQIAVVKLKEAKQYLKDFFYIPDGVPVYQENDIMLAVAYLNGLALVRNQPLVICLAVGTSNGNHGDDASHLAAYLNAICVRRKRAVVAATGNEALTRHHYAGILGSDAEYEDVEVYVESGVLGFYMELWADAPELFAVSVISPTGEQTKRIPVRSGSSERFNFVFERTQLTVDYRIESKKTASELVFFRFALPTRGIWKIRVYPQSTVTGRYHIWLPMRELVTGTVYFLRSNPDITLTSPGSVSQVITAGGYQAAGKSIYAQSGRGYMITGEVKPDFAAPAVNVTGPGLRGNYVRESGSSIAAGITVGAVAQVMQWAHVEGHMPTLSNAGIKNLLIRGAERSADRIYPNREWGYGRLDVYQAFDVLRGI